MVDKFENAKRPGLPSVTGFFDATKGHVVGDPGRVVDENHAGFNLLGDLPAPRCVPRVDRTAEAIFRVVGDPDCCTLIGNNDDGRYGSEQLFFIGGHSLAHVRQDCGLEEGAIRIGPLAAENDAGASGNRAIDLLLQFRRGLR